MPNLPHDFYAMSQRKRRKDKTPHLLYKRDDVKDRWIESTRLFSLRAISTHLCRYTFSTVNIAVTLSRVVGLTEDSAVYATLFYNCTNGFAKRL